MTLLAVMGSCHLCDYGLLVTSSYFCRCWLLVITMVTFVATNFLQLPLVTFVTSVTLPYQGLEFTLPRAGTVVPAGVPGVTKDTAW